MLVGDSGVGKTCLLVRFKDGAFLAGTFISTVGIDFRVSGGPGLAPHQSPAGTPEQQVLCDPRGTDRLEAWTPEAACLDLPTPGLVAAPDKHS